MSPKKKQIFKKRYVLRFHLQAALVNGKVETFMDYVFQFIPCGG